MHDQKYESFAFAQNANEKDTATAATETSTLTRYRKNKQTNKQTDIEKQNSTQVCHLVSGTQCWIWYSPYKPYSLNALRFCQWSHYIEHCFSALGRVCMGKSGTLHLLKIRNNLLGVTDPKFEPIRGTIKLFMWTRPIFELLLPNN